MRYSFLLLFVFCALQSVSQKKYFQQQTDFNIEVLLDDQHHILRGFETIHYQNNSPDTLRFIFFHLWPNAYKNDRTAFTEQLVENGKKTFYFSKANDHGFIDSLQFEVNNEPVNVSNFNNYEDVILIELPSPLPPAQSIEISTPFRVVLPTVCSRLGHIDQDYQICQWYPKPAVYDAQGWHPMPYLDQGEFYSEFGAYQVSITLPESYWVAATGILQTSSEKEAIRKRAENKEDDISDSKRMKTIQYQQDRIHDFAWFASRDYLIRKEEIKLNTRTIPCYCFFKPIHKELYKNSTEIASKTIRYLSEHVGPYPYDQVSLVEGVTSDIAGGMEYPMLAHIGSVKSEDDMCTVIVHEVGHNWFYGILGSNERDFAWMDEGVNSFYEKEIVKQIKEEKNADKKKDFAAKLGDILGNRFLYELSHQQHIDQAIEIPSSHFTSLNYGAMIYSKFPIMFDYLRSYLGQPTFERIMKAYYQAWQFKHPQPEDVKKIFEQESGKNLSWFFDDLLKTNTRVDFKLKKRADHFIVSSKTKFHGPIPLSAFRGDTVLQTQWSDYPYETAMLHEPTADYYRTTFKRDWFDANPKNSFYKTKGLFHRYRLGISALTTLGVSEKHHLNVLPAFGYNYYDHLQAGLALRNIQLPNQAFQYALAPMYSFHTASLIGTGFMAYSFFPTQTFHKITLGVQGKSFHDNLSDLNISKPLFTRYIKVQPFLLFDFKPAYARSPVKRTLLASVFGIHQQGFRYNQNSVDSLYRPNLLDAGWNYYGFISYQHKNNRTFNPFSYEVDASGNQAFLKLRLTAQLKIDYHYLNKAFYIRGFAGKFFELNPKDYSFGLQNQYLAATSGASNDYLYGETYLARNEQDGWMAKQIAMNEGGMKIRTSFLANPIGLNDNWLGALNLRSDLPIQSKLKLQLFLDIATYNKAAQYNSSGNKMIYDAGVEWHLFSDLLTLYVPLLNCKDYKDYLKSTYAKNRLLQSCTFSLNLNKINWLNTQELITRYLN